MVKHHPHTDATYQVISLSDDTYSVTVSVPDAHPARVSPFTTAADAEAWIAKHKSQVEARNAMAGRPRAMRTRPDTATES